MNRALLLSAAALWLAAQPGCTPPLAGSALGAANASGDEVWLSPTALAASPDGKRLFIACATANRVAVFDTTSNQISATIAVPGSPLGLAVSKDGGRVYVTCAAPLSTVCMIDPAQARITCQISAGHTTMAPVLSPDEKTLYVCNRFNNDVSIIDLATRQETGRIKVQREPVSAAITPDGKLLLVANHLHAGRADHGGAAAAVTVIDTASRKVVKEIVLPRGSSLLRGIAVSPDGRFAAVTHLLAHYYLPTTEVDFGHINANALSVLDLNRLEWIRLVLLDHSARGAANPWAVAWTPDGQTIVVTHAGTHELSLVDAPIVPQKPIRARQRIPVSGGGPRALAFAGPYLYVANYFSDTLSRLNLTVRLPEAESLELTPVHEPLPARKGEALFNDARLCLQEWQSCASCHSADARMDGLNWDLLNDGLGNPKNAKSLLLAHSTPPAMWMGVRATAETAVRAGIRHILFMEQPEAVPAAIDAYLMSLKPVPSPHLVDGKLSAAAERGEALFLSEVTGCARCHPGPLFTDRHAHDVGTRGRRDQPADIFDTPSLVELWRTAPYLHDGSAATVRDVLTLSNSQGEHGKTSHLTTAQLDDLAEYLLSL